MNFKMADNRKTRNEQENASDTLKKIHTTLRKEVRSSNNFKDAWNEHKTNLKSLDQYATAMVSLATIWKDSQPPSENRINWCMSVCRKYFWNGGLKKILEKATKKDYHDALRNGEQTFRNFEEFYEKHGTVETFLSDFKDRKLRLLDVGSCYDPFVEFSEEIDVIAIDLCPASQGVYQADFLELLVGMSTENEIKPKKHFSDEKTSDIGVHEVTVNNIGHSIDACDQEETGQSSSRDEEKREKSQTKFEEQALKCLHEKFGTSGGDKISKRKGASTEHCGKSLLESFKSKEQNNTGPKENSKCSGDKKREENLHTKNNLDENKSKISCSEIDNCKVSNMVKGYDRGRTYNNDCDECESQRSERIKDVSSSLQITKLPGKSFDVIVFSLFLSYLPTPLQRWQSCVKANKLLRHHGLLIIIEPDSSHQNRNANQIRDWKRALASIGLTRFAYEKLTHLHCMAFRKTCDAEDDIDESVAMYIPQDFNDEDSETEVSTSKQRDDTEDKTISEMFMILPNI